MKKSLTILLGLTLIILSSSCVTTARTAHVHTKTVVIKKTPKQHKVVHLKGHKYYTWGGKYYKKTRNGFVIVKF